MLWVIVQVWSWSNCASVIDQDSDVNIVKPLEMVIQILKIFEIGQICNNMFDFNIFIDPLEILYLSFNILFVTSNQKQIESELGEYLYEASSDSIGEACDAYIAISICVFKVGSVESGMVEDVMWDPVSCLDCPFDEME